MQAQYTRMSAVFSGFLSGRFGANLGAVQAHRAHAQQLHLVRHLQHLDKQLGEFTQKAATKGGQGVVVGVGACGNVAKGDRVEGGPLDLAAGEHACGVAIDQQGEQGGWVMGLGATASVLAGEARDIESINDFDHEAGQVVLREPVVYRRGSK